jgi:hypothetical protein
MIVTSVGFDCIALADITIPDLDTHLHYFLADLTLSVLYLDVWHITLIEYSQLNHLWRPRRECRLAEGSRNTPI